MHTTLSERQVRYALARKGYRLLKTPARHWSRKFYEPGYQIADYSNTIVEGCGSREFQSTLEDCIRFTEKS